MRNDKRGAISFEQIILFILAIVVLIVVVAFFTGTFEKIRKPVDIATGEIEKGIECSQLCGNKDYPAYCSNECYKISGVSCTRDDGVSLTAQGCSA